MGQKCKTPKFKKKHHARKVGIRTYIVKIRGASRKVKILCSGKWKFLKGGAKKKKSKKR